MIWRQITHLPIGMTWFWQLLMAVFVYVFVANAVSVFSKFCHFIMSRFNLVQRFVLKIHKIVLSNVAPFWLNIFVNKQNCRNWGYSVTLETQYHAQVLITFCELWCDCIIVHYFVRNESENAVTINSERFNTMSTDCFFHNLKKSTRTISNLESFWIKIIHRSSKFLQRK